MRVLVADDDSVSRRVLEVTLSRWGYEVITCSDGVEAWEGLRSKDPPEIAVLDWMMPGVDGLEVCRRVRRSSNSASVYIILLTARDSRDDIVKGLLGGADDYLSKPFDREELRARVRVGSRLMGLQRQRLKRETAHYVEQLEQTVLELQLSRRRIVVVQEEAKKAIAEELHGPVQTQMVMLSLKLGEVRDMIDTSPKEAKAELARAAADLDGIRDNEIRDISHRLHPSIVGVGLSAGIKSLRDRYERWVPIDLEIAREVVERESAGSSTFPFDVRLGLYRVADEAMANVIKHAGATGVTISLWLDDRVDNLCLTVQDDGRGFEPDASRRGLGTVTMEDYLGALGGSIKMDTAPGEGTRISASVPR